jgi:hypothetical protein
MPKAAVSLGQSQRKMSPLPMLNAFSPAFPTETLRRPAHQSAWQ